MNELKFVYLTATGSPPYNFRREGLKQVSFFEEKDTAESPTL